MSVRGDRPNILLIVTDQQSASAMSCAGNAEVDTPAADSIAEGGVRFEKAYCTYPLCTPARASMFGGRYPHELGVRTNGERIAEQFREEELGFLLSGAGYDCAYGGKWHVPEISMPQGHGFRTICGFDDVGLPGACGEFFGEDREGPFFLVASFDNPHNICEWRREQTLPWGPIGPAPAVEDCPMLPVNFAIAPFEAEPARVKRNNDPRIYPGPEYSDEQWRRYRWAYFRLVEKVDSQIGQILSALRDNGLQDDTVIIFTSDHGDHHAEHHLVQKSIPYDAAVRVPFIVGFDGVGEGGVDDRHVVSAGVDLYATICDFAGIQPPEGTGGMSVRPLVEGNEGVGWREYVACEVELMDVECPARMIRTERYKYVVYGWGAYREQLFDMVEDPGEMVNLAVRSRYADVLGRHRDLLRDWCEATDDDFRGGHYSHPDTVFMVPGDEYPQSL